MNLDELLIAIAGWSALVSVMAEVLLLVYGIALIASRQPMDAFAHVLSAFGNLLGIPVLIALTLILRPGSGAKAMAGLVIGGLGMLIHLALQALVLAGALSSIAGSAPAVVSSAIGSVLTGIYLVWANWAARESRILKGALPWLGMVDGIAISSYALFSLGLLVGPSLRTVRLVGDIGGLFAILIYLTSGAAWKVWLGGLMIQNKIPAHS